MSDRFARLDDGRVVTLQQFYGDYVRSVQWIEYDSMRNPTAAAAATAVRASRIAESVDPLEVMARDRMPDFNEYVEAP